MCPGNGAGCYFNQLLQTAPKSQTIADMVGPAIDHAIANVVIAAMMDHVMLRTHQQICPLEKPDDPGFGPPMAEPVRVGSKGHDRCDNGKDAHQVENQRRRRDGESEEKKDWANHQYGWPGAVGDIVAKSVAHDMTRIKMMLAGNRNHPSANYFIKPGVGEPMHAS